MCSLEVGLGGTGDVCAVRSCNDTGIEEDVYKLGSLLVIKIYGG